jgi:dephospho-CoA kinase
VASTLLRVALTGGIATGKSYCVRRLRSLGAPVLDADVLAREAVAPGTAGLQAVAARFGPGVIRPDGSLDRAALGRIVFADPDARRDLEAIIHPEVRRATGRWFDDLAAAGAVAVAIADIPLLFEASREADFDRIVVVACRPEQQLQRLIARDRLSIDEARQRIAAQMPIDEKRARADDVIDTSGTEADTDRQVDDLWKRLKG